MIQTKWNQEEIARVFGVDQTTVSRWLGEEVVTIMQAHISYHPDSRVKVLKEAGAWDEIIVPTFQNMGTEDEDDDGTVNVPNGTKSIFTEGLLRNILDLDSGQQCELCGYLAKGKALKKICGDAWEIITSSLDVVIQQDDDAVIEDITTVISGKFSERLLRNILDLHSSQQSKLRRNVPVNRIPRPRG